MTESRFYVDHVRITANRPFADVQAAFERRLGKFEPGVYQALAADDADPARVRARIDAMAGPSGFMLFAARVTMEACCGLWAGGGRPCNTSWATRCSPSK